MLTNIAGRAAEYLNYVEVEQWFFILDASTGAWRFQWNDTEDAGVIATREAAIDAAQTDPAFLAWLDAHGGDQVLTLQREAKDDIIDGDSSLSVAQRAELSERNKRDNWSANRLIEIQDTLTAMKAAGNLNAMKDAIPATFAPTQTRPLADARQDLRDAIDAGEGDS